ncbi:YrhC family protein [Fictibacillus phosphorivorans]|uniref:YrhC family protein n=1 Tax=Fictibacillus phosphorivorans TaxID=1221500 RepID=UPI00203FE156|nr:YrhC family protein [Fictibacillus phosphorivorans]MCM3716947.1 YrhC family protein [Fictibacillus phosphorivorans]MCM3774504.1 YrhC family protein [Fictibacillus phosphorivorans]
MTNKLEKELQKKIADYQRFGFILLAVSTFFYVGLVLPVEDKNFTQSMTLGIASLMCLGFTALMYNVVRKCKVQLQEIAK